MTATNCVQIFFLFFFQVYAPLIFIPIYWFDQKQLFKQIQIFLRIWPFTNKVRITNFLSTSVLISEIVTFMSKKKKNSLWISPKMLQNNREALFKLYVAHFVEKNSFC